MASPWSYVRAILRYYNKESRKRRIEKRIEGVNRLNEIHQKQVDEIEAQLMALKLSISDWKIHSTHQVKIYSSDSRDDRSIPIRTDAAAIEVNGLGQCRIRPISPESKSNTAVPYLAAKLPNGYSLVDYNFPEVARS